MPYDYQLLPDHIPLDRKKDCDLEIINLIKTEMEEKFKIADLANAVADCGETWENIAPGIVLNSAIRKVVDYFIPAEKLGRLINELHKQMPTFPSEKLYQKLCSRPFPRPLIGDPHWRSKLDRIYQTALVVQDTDNMLDRGSPRGLVFAWYGEPKQGVELFALRIKIELGAKRIIPVEIPMNWVTTQQNFDAALRELYWKSLLDESNFDSSLLSLFGSKLRDRLPYGAGRKNLVFIYHKPFSDSSGQMTPEILEKYLQWLKTIFFSGVFNPPEDVYFLFGFPFLTQEIRNFEKYSSVISDARDDPASPINIMDLMAFERVTAVDIASFLSAHNIKHISKKTINAILAQTHGNYEETLAALQAKIQNPCFEL